MVQQLEEDHVPLCVVLLVGFWSRAVSKKLYKEVCDEDNFDTYFFYSLVVYILSTSCDRTASHLTYVDRESIMTVQLQVALYAFERDSLVP
jgi:hypothetical protein